MKLVYVRACLSVSIVCMIGCSSAPLPSHPESHIQTPTSAALKEAKYWCKASDDNVSDSLYFFCGIEVNDIPLLYCIDRVNGSETNRLLLQYSACDQKDQYWSQNGEDAKVWVCMFKRGFEFAEYREKTSTSSLPQETRNAIHSCKVVFEEQPQ